MNPILQSIMSNKLLQTIGPVKQMINTVQAAGNPALALQQMASSNPMIQQAMQLVQQSGGDGKAAFEKLAKENGIDPDQIMQMLK